MKLLQDFECPAFAKDLRSGGNVLPAQQPAHELRGSHRLDLLAQRPEREPVNSRQQPPIAPFNFLRGEVPVKCPRRYRATCLQAQKRLDQCPAWRCPAASPKHLRSHGTGDEPSNR